MMFIVIAVLHLPLGRVRFTSEPVRRGTAEMIASLLSALPGCEITIEETDTWARG